MPPIGSLHLDQALTNLSIQYKNDFFIADQIFRELSVEKRSNKYFVYDKSMMLRATRTDANGDPISLRRPRTVAAEVDFSLSTDSYFCQEYARAGLVSDAEVAIADNPLRPDQDMTEYLTEIMKLDNEIKVANIVGNTNNYAAANKATLTTGGSGTSWAQYASASSLPLNNIRDGILQVRKGVMKEANTLLLTIDTARYLADHPTIKDLIKYVASDGLSRSGLPKMLRGLEVIEGAAQKDSSVEGAAFSGGNIWVDSGGNNMAVICYVGPDGGEKTVHFGRTFQAPDDTTKAVGYSVRRWRDEPRKGDMIELSMLRDWKLVSVDVNSKTVAAYLLLSATV